MICFFLYTIDLEGNVLEVFFDAFKVYGLSHQREPKEHERTGCIFHKGWLTEQDLFGFPPTKRTFGSKSQKMFAKLKLFLEVWKELKHYGNYWIHFLLQGSFYN